jgi:hypothetical protein
MTTPRRRLILQDLRTTLQGITPANGYHTTVARVSRTWPTRSLLDSGPRAYVGIMPGPRRTEYEPAYECLCRLTVEVVGLIAVEVDPVTAATLTGTALEDALEDKVEEACNEFEDDLTVAVHVDPTRGGYASETRIMGVETNEGDPQVPTERSGIVRATLEVQYFRTSNVAATATT